VDAVKYLADRGDGKLHSTMRAEETKLEKIIIRDYKNPCSEWKPKLLLPEW